MKKFVLTMGVIWGIMVSVSGCAKSEPTSKGKNNSESLKSVESEVVSASSDDTFVQNGEVNAENNNNDYNEINQEVETKKALPTEGIGDYLPQSSWYIEAEAVYQNPELPAGCEITSLTALLNFWGFGVDKVTLCDEFLTIDLDYNSTFDEAFIGNPKDGTGFGCYAPVIVDAANKYLDYVDSDLDVMDLTGTNFQNLFMQLENNRPVLVWASMSLVETREYLCYIADDGDEAWWIENEHCMMLTGFDYDEETVTVCDPLKGEYTYSMSAFEERYDELGKQAVVIY